MNNVCHIYCWVLFTSGSLCIWWSTDNSGNKIIYTDTTVSGRLDILHPAWDNGGDIYDVCEARCHLRCLFPLLWRMAVLLSISPSWRMPSTMLSVSARKMSFIFNLVANFTCKENINQFCCQFHFLSFIWFYFFKNAFHHCHCYGYCMSFSGHICHW